jgi:hypothetical protein
MDKPYSTSGRAPVFGFLRNCSKATFLISKAQETPLSLRETFLLKLHLAGCSFCRRFRKQSLLIGARLEEVLDSGHTLLGEEKKEALRRLIRNSSPED